MGKIDFDKFIVDLHYDANSTLRRNIDYALKQQGFKIQGGEIMVDLPEDEEPKPKRKICNFCGFAEACRLAEAVHCTEEHHQDGKDFVQYYGHTCEYYKDSDNNIYDLER